MHCLKQLERRSASDHAALVTVRHHLLCIDRTQPAPDSEIDSNPIIADESPSGLVCRQVVDDLGLAQVQRCVLGWPRPESCADLIDLDDLSDAVASDLDRSTEPVRTCYSERPASRWIVSVQWALPSNCCRRRSLRPTTW